MGGSKTVKFENTFSLESFPLYGNVNTMYILCYHNYYNIVLLSVIVYCRVNPPVQAPTIGHVPICTF